jgi:DNA-binding MarR family transcriptional regulator
MYSEKFGLTVSTWKVLSAIGRFGPLSATETGTRTNLEPDKVTRAVDALTGQGFVARRQDSGDRRRVVLSLTAKGKRVHESVSKVRDALEHEFLSVLAPVEIAALYSILDKLESRAMEIFTDKKAWRTIVERQVAGSRPAEQHAQRPLPAGAPQRRSA